MPEQRTRPEPHRLGPDGGAAAVQFSPATQRAIGALIAAAESGRAGEELISAAAEAIVAEARHHDLRAEEMLVQLKAQWLPLVDERGWQWTQRMRDLTDRLITRCITSYYAPLRTGGNGNGQHP